MDQPARVRIDKWLWAARFFKTRAMAAHACELGRVESNGQTAKPSREVRLGDRLRVKNGAGEFEVEVCIVHDVRGPAAVAQTFYLETDASKQRRAELAEQKAAQPAFDLWDDGRPSKRDRRIIDRLRGR
jgi:ribosome-associated heat shock protein Hsp15